MLKVFACHLDDLKDGEMKVSATDCRKRKLPLAKCYYPVYQDSTLLPHISARITRRLWSKACFRQTAEWFVRGTALASAYRRGILRV
jgi:hypothetical protein